MFKRNENIVWQSYTAGHIEFVKNVSYDKFLNTDPELAAFIHALMPRSGLPDGLFSNQKSQIWIKFGGPWIRKCCYF
jgi:hypothetical protein